MTLVILNDYREQETFAYTVELSIDELERAKRVHALFAADNEEYLREVSWLTSIIRDSDRAVEVASPWDKRPIRLDQGAYVIIISGTSNKF